MRTKRRTGDDKSPEEIEVPIEPAELEDDTTAEDAREAAAVLGVPEWVDPETGELADDEFTRLEDH